jgi:hypothetical protein
MIIGGKALHPLYKSLSHPLIAAGDLPKPPEKPVVFLEGRLNGHK